MDIELINLTEARIALSEAKEEYSIGVLEGLYAALASDIIKALENQILVENNTFFY